MLLYHPSDKLSVGGLVVDALCSPMAISHLNTV